MKKVKNSKGFALVETIVCALFVATIFTLLFTQMYPLSGNFEATEHFDDIQTKYIAHYLKQIIVTDRVWTEKRHFYNQNPDVKYSLFDLLYNSAKGSGILVGVGNRKVSTNSALFCEGGFSVKSDGTLNVKDNISLGLTNEKTLDIDTGEKIFNGKNNAYFCRQYVEAANITGVWFFPYNLSDVKSGARNEGDELTYAASSNNTSMHTYLMQLPTHKHSWKATSKNPRYMWMVIEVKHENKNTDETGDYYYSYAAIEVHE